MRYGLGNGRAVDGNDVYARSNRDMAMTEVRLSKRQITLLRVALILRMTKMKNGEESMDSYAESYDLCQILWDARERTDNGEAG